MRRTVFILNIVVMFSACFTSFVKAQNTLSLEVHKDQSHALSTGVYGVNSNVVTKPYNHNDDNLVDLYKQLGSPVMRYPGGTVGNYYDYETGRAIAPSYATESAKSRVVNINNGIDSKKDDQQFKLTDYIDFMNETEAVTDYMLNVCLKTAEENRPLFEAIRDAGQTFDYVELGNELYFGTYVWAEASVNTYIANAKAQAAMIREVSPCTKIGVIIPSHLYTHESFLDEIGHVTGDRQISWYDKMAEEDFFDAISIHTYSTTGMPSDVAAADFLSYPDSYKYAISHLDEKTDDVYETLALDFPDKEVWVTEYHIGGFSGDLRQFRLRYTYLGGLHTANQMLKLFSHSNVGMSSWHQYSQLMNNNGTSLALNAHFFKVFNTPVHLSNQVAPVSVNGTLNYEGVGEHPGTFQDVEGLLFYKENNGHLVLINKLDKTYEIDVSSLHTALGVSNISCTALQPDKTLTVDEAIVSESAKTMGAIDPIDGVYSITPYSIFTFSY